MSRGWVLDLDDGSSIARDVDGTLRVTDCHGVPFSVSLDDDAAARILGAIARDPHGIANLWGATPVSVAHIYTDDAGSVVLFIYACDRSGVLAPIYLTAQERKELADVIR